MSRVKTAGNLQTKDANPTCGTVTLGIVKQVGPAVASAVTNWLKGVLTVANIEKCLTCTGEKIDDDLGRNKQPANCGPGQSAPGSGRPSAPPGNHSGSSKLADPQRSQHQFVDYPSSFSKDAPKVPTQGSKLVNWNLAEKSSVVKRWQSAPAKV